MAGSARCNLHGGKSLAGLASPTFKTGRYSKVLPARLLERYQEAIRDPELLALRDEIGLVDARLGDLLRRVETGESGAMWRALQEHLDTLDVAGLDPLTQLKSVRDLIQQGIDESKAWGEIYLLLERRRKLSESETKRLAEAQQIITSEQAMALLAAVVEVIRGHVRDRATLAAISAAIRGLMAANPR